MRTQSVVNEQLSLMYFLIGAERWIFLLSSLREVNYQDIIFNQLAVLPQRHNNFTGFAIVSEPFDIIGFQKTSHTYNISTYTKAATSLSKMSTRLWSRKTK